MPCKIDLRDATSYHFNMKTRKTRQKKGEAAKGTPGKRTATKAKKEAEGSTGTEAGAAKPDEVGKKSKRAAKPQLVTEDEADRFVGNFLEDGASPKEVARLQKILRDEQKKHPELKYCKVGKAGVYMEFDDPAFGKEVLNLIFDISDLEVFKCEATLAGTDLVGFIIDTWFKVWQTDEYITNSRRYVSRIRKIQEKRTELLQEAIKLIQQARILEAVVIKVPEPPPGFVTAEAAIEILGCSRSWLESLAQRGKITSKITDGWRRYFARADLLKVAAKNQKNESKK